jgi:predicted transcriptional regulator
MIMKVVIEADDRYRNMLNEIAIAINAKITFQEKDFWDGLPVHVKSEILESQEQIGQGKFRTHQEVMEKYRSR